MVSPTILSIELPQLRATLLQWCSLRRREREIEPHLTALASALQGASPFFAAYGSRLAANLVERTTGAAALAEAMQASSGAAASPQLVQWLTWAAEPSPTSESLLDLLQSGNRLAVANVSSSMADAAKSGAPRSLIASLEALRAHDTQWCRGYPLMPAAGRSPRAADYILAADIRELCERVCPQLATLQTSFTGRLRVAEAGDRATLAQLAATSRELQSATEATLQDWPLERAWLQTIASDAIVLLDALHESGAASGVFRQIEQAAKTAACVSVDASAETSPADFSEHTTLSELIKSIESTAEAEALRFADCLREAEASDSQEEAARRHLQCLTQIDDLWLRPGKRPSWIVQARAALRECLLSDGVYQLQESSLVGRHPDECAALIEIVGFANKTKVASGRIAEVRLPGYTASTDGGSPRVLRRAKILLSP